MYSDLTLRTLEEFLTLHRLELIERCRIAAATRFEPAARQPSFNDNGVPQFLLQIIDTLRGEREASEGDSAGARSPFSASELGRVAALRGAELLSLGYTIEQVVREYGDVCQTVTTLAVDLKTDISADEFRTLKRCLDDAIAEAVRAISCSVDRSARGSARIDKRPIR